MTVFLVRNDPGHGWLIVSRAQLASVGLSEADISPYSYADPTSDMIGLEEDMDATAFYHAWIVKHGTPFETKEEETGAIVRNSWGPFGKRVNGPKADAASIALRDQATAILSEASQSQTPPDEDEEDEDVTQITARTIPDDERLSFLPRVLAGKYMLFENTVYGFADRNSKDYSGGFWTFVELSNGGFFIHPIAPEHFNVSCWGNHFEGRLSADAFGIGLTLFALSHMSFEKGAPAILAERYHQLYEFAARHGEAELIFQFID